MKGNLVFWDLYRIRHLEIFGLVLARKTYQADDIPLDSAQADQAVEEIKPEEARYGWTSRRNQCIGLETVLGDCMHEVQLRTLRSFGVVPCCSLAVVYYQEL